MSITVDDLHQHHKHHRIITYGIITLLVVLSVSIISMSKSLETASVDYRSQAASGSNISGLTSLRDFNLSCYRQYCLQSANKDALSCYKRYCQSNVTPTPATQRGLQNGDFELWNSTNTMPLYWKSDYQNIQLSASKDKTQGAYSVLIPKPPAQYSNVNLNSNLFLLDSGTYTMSLMVKGLQPTGQNPSGYTGVLQVYLISKPRIPGDETICVNQVVPTTQWQQYSVTCNIPDRLSGFEYVSLISNNSGYPDTMPDVLVDDIQIIKQ